MASPSGPTGTMGQSAGPAGGPEGASQFWDDFWNTLYQFTHPFSSTFFDSLFTDEQTGASATAGSSSPSSQPDIPPAGTEGAAGADSKQYFKDEASFEKFWHGLQKGAYHHESNPSTPFEHVQSAWIDFKSAASGFVSSVEWQQTWIQMVLALHLSMFTIILLLRNRPNPLAAMLFCTILLAALSEPLNGIGSRHWKLFADDNYFDSHGVFTSLVWAGPLLGNALLAVLLLLRATAGMLVKVKRAQLQESKRKKQK